jgi:hypothetical protein
MSGIDVSHLSYTELIALRDTINQRLLTIQRSHTLRLDEILALFEETRTALHDHGHRWHTLERWQWMDGEVRFWLNPVDQERYTVGWFSIDDLIAWQHDSGPVLRNTTTTTSNRDDVSVRWLTVDNPPK